MTSTKKRTKRYPIKEKEDRFGLSTSEREEAKRLLFVTFSESFSRSDKVFETDLWEYFSQSISTKLREGALHSLSAGQTNLENFKGVNWSEREVDRSSFEGDVPEKSFKRTLENWAKLLFANRCGDGNLFATKSLWSFVPWLNKLISFSFSSFICCMIELRSQKQSGLSPLIVSKHVLSC